MRWVVMMAATIVACGGDGASAVVSTTADAGTTAPAMDASEAGGSTGGDASEEGDVASTTAGSSGGAGDSTSAGEDSGTTGAPAVTFADCVDGVFVHGYPGIDFDAYGVTVGSHCVGTDHQAIAGIERVVFLGDSITVGTPPTGVEDSYRAVLADLLAEDFGLSFGANKVLWQAPNPLDGQSFELHSGDFSSCARWGDQNEDLLAGDQVADCYPPEDRDRVTLTIMTSGGNDVAAIGDAGVAGATLEEMLAMADAAVEQKRDTLRWLTDPENFPSGGYVVFADVYDPTDGTLLLEDCDLSALVGFEDFMLPPVEVMQYLQQRYAELSVETGTDLLFMHKEFCGHGHPAANPDAPCYRAPRSPVWFDVSCSHPNPEGHAALAAAFRAVVSE